MKKLVIGILSSAIILGAGTFTYAKVSDDAKDTTSYKEMRTQMKEMHPNLSEKELKEMYQNGKEMMKDMNMDNMNMDSMNMDNMNHNGMMN